jgi:hypothetical protein
MRVYIIGTDGITLCRKASATVNDGEFAVASNEELRAAPLSAKRLLALWNALPDVEKRKKVGDREALIDQLWSAIEALPDSEPPPPPPQRHFPLPLARPKRVRCRLAGGERWIRTIGTPPNFSAARRSGSSAPRSRTLGFRAGVRAIGGGKHLTDCRAE